MKKLYYILSVVSLVLTASLDADAQMDKSDVRKGNRDFRKENYREAEIDYRKALIKDSMSVAANYNLANTLYKEGDAEQASKTLERIKDAVSATDSAADYYFNLGDVAIARQDWQGAVDAFKESLLLRPGDLEAKENYIYARMKLQDQQDQQNQQNQQNQDQQDQQNQDQQDDKDQDNKDQQDQNNDQDRNEDQNKDQEQKPQQGEQPKITPQAAQQMLQAIQAKEKETQDKVNRQKAEALKSRQKDKNW